MKAINTRFVLPLLIFAFLPFVATAQQPKQVGGKPVKSGIWKGKQLQYIAGEISVKLTSAASETQIQLLFERHNATVVDPVDELGWGTIRLPERKSVLSVAKALKKSPLVIEAGPNMVIHNHSVPDDPYFQGNSPASYAHQWALKNTGQSPPGGTNDDDIDAELAWDLTTGNSNTVIAVLDSGIPMQNGSLSHLDLDDSNKIILGPDYIDPNQANGVKDENGHGTHVAGIAAAETNNGEGIAGVCWNCKILVVQVADANGGLDVSSIYNGFKYAVDYAVNNNVELVINASFGGRSDPAGQIEDAVDYAESHNVLIVASAGNYEPGFPLNENDGTDCPVHYPASYSAQYSNIIAVASTDPNDGWSTFSCTGSELIVAAPGGTGGTYDSNDVFSTYPNYSYMLQNDHNITQVVRYSSQVEKPVSTGEIEGSPAS